MPASISPKIVEAKIPTPKVVDAAAAALDNAAKESTERASVPRNSVVRGRDSPLELNMSTYVVHFKIGC